MIGHEGVKYSCSECEFKATIKSNLNTHIKSIREEVKYPCSECDYEATQKGNLNTHVKSVQIIIFGKNKGLVIT